MENLDDDRKRAEVFDALGHPARILILKALNEGPLGFADLKKRVHIESSGHLTHHLNKLNGLIKTDDYGQYFLSDQGKDALLTVETVENVAGSTSTNKLGKTKPSSNVIGKRTVLKVIAIGLAVLLVASAMLNIYEYQQITALQNRVNEQGRIISELQTTINDLREQQNATLLVVQDNYPTIQSAINAASPGGIVFVKKGVYYENPVINTPLSLIGENSSETIIMVSPGMEDAPGILIRADNCTVYGFTIESKPDPRFSIPADAIVLYANSAQIFGNNIRSCYSAVVADNSGSSSIISENYVTSNMFTAIRFWGSVQKRYSLP